MQEASSFPKFGMSRSTSFAEDRQDVDNTSSLVCQFVVDGRGVGAVSIRTLDKPIEALLAALVMELDLPSTLFKAELPLSAGPSDDALRHVLARDAVAFGCRTCFCTMYTRPMAEDTIPTRQLRSELRHCLQSHDLESGYVSGKFTALRASSQSEHYQGMKPKSLEWEFVKSRSEGWAVSFAVADLPMSVLVSELGKQVAPVAATLDPNDPQTEIGPFTIGDGSYEVKFDKFDPSLASIYNAVFGDFNSLPRQHQVEAVRFDLQRRIVESILSHDDRKHKTPLKPSYRRVIVEVLASLSKNATADSVQLELAALKMDNVLPRDVRLYTPEVLISDYDEQFNDSVMNTLVSLPEGASPEMYHEALKPELSIHTPALELDRVPVAYLQELRETALASGKYSPNQEIEVSVADGMSLHLDRRHYLTLSDGTLQLSQDAIDFIAGRKDGGAVAQPPVAAQVPIVNQNAAGLRGAVRVLYDRSYQYALRSWDFVNRAFVVLRAAGGGNVVFAAILIFMTETDTAPLWVTCLLSAYLYVSVVRMLVHFVFHVDLSEKLVDWLPPIYRSATSPEELLQFIPPEAAEFLDKEQKVVHMMALRPSFPQILAIVIGTLEPTVCVQWIQRVRARQRMHKSAVELAKSRADEAAAAREEKEKAAEVKASEEAESAAQEAAIREEAAFESAPEIDNDVPDTEVRNPERPSTVELDDEREPLLVHEPEPEERVGLDAMDYEPLPSEPGQPLTPQRQTPLASRNEILSGEQDVPDQDPNTSIFTEHLESP